MPKKHDSMKNAKIASAASGLPNTSPTKREYRAQFVPNSNSSTMPVATPNAKTSAKIFVQKSASARQTGSFVFRAKPCATTRKTPRPIDSGGNRK